MKWLGQHIVELIARFRSSIYLENLESSSETAALVVDSNGKITKNASLVSSGTTDLTSDVTGVLPVANGGTGASSLTVTSLLTGNGTSAVQAESGLTYSGELLVIGDSDAGLAEVTRRNSSTATAGQFRLRGSTATGTDKVGGELSLAGGPGTGTGASGAIKFYSWTPYGGTGSSAQFIPIEIAGFDSAGNLQIDGGLTTGSTSAINSSGVIQVASQPNITTLAGVFTGSANQLVTDDGDGTVTSESKLTFDGTSETLELGGDTFNSFKIQRKAHSDNIGGEVRMYSGDAGGTNKAGGDFEIYSGKGTGNALGGAIKFYVSTPGSSGDTSHSVQAVDLTITDGQVAVGGDITVTGTVDGRDVATDGTKLDGIADNATADQTNVTGSSGSCTGNAATATALATARAINGVDFDGTAPITVTAAGSTLSDTVPVSKGGTGATTLTSTALLTGNGESAIQAESDLTFTSGTLTLTDGNINKPIIQIKSTGGFAHTGGSLDFITDEGDAGASGDILGRLRFIGDNADQDIPQQTYASIQGKVDVATDGEESGILELQVANHDDDLGTGLTLTGGSANDEIDVTVGLGSSSRTTIAGDITIDGNNISNNTTAANFTIGSSRILELQHTGVYNIQLGNSTNPDVLKVEGDAQEVTINGTLELGHATDTTIARSAPGTVTIEGKTIATTNKTVAFFNSSFFNSGTSSFYAPFNYIFEQTSLSTASYFGMISAPYDGKVLKVSSRTQSGTSKTTTVEMYLNGDDSDLTNDQVGTDLVIGSYTSGGTGTCASDWVFSAGDALSFRITNSAGASGQTLTFVIEFDLDT